MSILSPMNPAVILVIAALSFPCTGASGASSLLQPQDPGQQEHQPMQWARVQNQEAALRCFASDRSPVFEDRLAKGTIVRVGPAEGLFRPVELPLGPLGYVHKSFSEAPAFVGEDAGFVKTSGSDISFRYRPRDGEAPVARLPKGAKLHWMGQSGDWWQVRAPGQQAYLAASDIEILEGADETAKASFNQWVGTVRSQWHELVGRETAGIAERQRNDGWSTRLDQVALELARPKEQRNLQLLASETTALLAEIPAEASVRPRAEQLAKAVEFQQKLHEVMEATPPPAPAVENLVPPTPRGALERFTSVGWLNFQPRENGLARFQLQKGGVTLARLVAAKGRYDLSIFDGYEVGIVGNYNLPQGSGVRTLEVERLEIISRPTNR